MVDIIGAVDTLPAGILPPNLVFSKRIFILFSHFISILSPIHSCVSMGEDTLSATEKRYSQEVTRKANTEILEEDYNS